MFSASDIESMKKERELSNVSEEYFFELEEKLKETFIIVVEGLDLVGKTTFSLTLKEHLETLSSQEEKKGVEVIKFPSKEDGRVLRRLVSDPYIEHLFKKERVLFSLINNINAFERMILSSASLPRYLILDRYLLSSFVYNSTLPEKRGFFYYNKNEFNSATLLLQTIFKYAPSLIKPDVIIYLEASKELREERFKERVEKERKDFLDRKLSLEEELSYKELLFNQSLDELSLSLHDRQSLRYKAIIDYYRYSLNLPLIIQYTSSTLKEDKEYAKIVASSLYENLTEVNRG